MGTTKGVWGMKLCRWFVRGLGVACLVLGGIMLGGAAVTITAPSAYAQTVNTIVVQGNQRVEADTVRSYFRPGPGGRLDAFQIDEGVKALYSTGLFQDIRPSVQGGRLILTVVENPVINRIAFEGNKKVKDEQLKAEIQSKERGTLSRPVVQADVARLVEVYRRSGRFDIRIDPKIIELPNNRVDLVFEINEGGKTGVKVIDSSAIGPIRPIDSRTSSRPAKPASSRSCRPATFTIPTGSKRIASCCADSISSTATSTCVS